MAEPGLSELITTTARRRQRKLRDDLRNNNAVYASMEDNDGIVFDSGGRTIVEEMLYAENATFMRYDGAQVLNTSYNPTMTSAEFDWKQSAVAIVITGKEELMNAGKEQMISLADGRMTAAEYTLQNNLNADLLSNGTADGGKQIGGLALHVSKTPTSGTVGGIDRSTAAGTFYRNFKLDVINDNITTPATGATTSTNIQDRLTYCIINTTRLMDRVKLLLMGTTHYRALMTSMQAIQRITSDSKGSIGYKNLEFEGIPAVLGGGVSFGGEALVQNDVTYGLNTKFLKLHIHRDANMEPLEKQQSINQHAKVQLIVSMMNMTSSNERVQFVMFDS